MQHKVLIMLVISLFLTMIEAEGESLHFPNHLSEIEAETFAEDCNIKEVIISDSVTAIGDRAFQGCDSLEYIVIPDSVREIGEDAISDCASDVLIVSTPESAGYEYAVFNGIDYRCDTTYRALLIGQSYKDIPHLSLQGPPNDVESVSNCIAHFAGTAFQENIYQELNASDILSAIEDTLGEAKPWDVSLLYYSGHGKTAVDEREHGALLGIDGKSCVTAEQLRAALDRIPGRKIIIIDACYSGYFLNNSDETDIQAKASLGSGDANTFVQSFIQAFQRKGRTSLAGDAYYVLTSASDTELSYEDSFEGKQLGLFTAALLRGCGYWDATAPADSNQNGVITLDELFEYTYQELIYEGQHVQAYPPNCVQFGVLRNK